LGKTKANGNFHVHGSNETGSRATRATDFQVSFGNGWQVPWTGVMGMFHGS
jgi:hypothetical protein